MSALFPLLVIDAANVVGSVPDGWWRDRHGATERLRDHVASLALDGLASADRTLDGPLEIALVVEGAARGVQGVSGVRVVAAEGSGDDAIVAVVRARPGGQPCFVATADRGLIARVEALGARVIGPRAVRR